MLEECLAYFSEREVFGKVFEGFVGKYESLGHMGGTIRLSGLTEEEKVQLGGFLQKDFLGQEVVSVSYKAVEKALEGSRFSGIGFLEILEAYRKERLVGNRERKEMQLREWEGFYEKQVEKCVTKEEMQWLLQIRERKGGAYKLLLSLYHADTLQCEHLLEQVCLAGSRLPVYEGRLELLSVFAARITGNPHEFDEGTSALQLLGSFLMYYFLNCESSGQNDETTSFKKQEYDISSVEKRWELLYQAGIVKDDLSNFVLTYGLRGRKKDGGVHGGLEGFYQEREPVLLTLQTLNGLYDLRAENRTVYMVENPAVFSYLCEKYPAEAFLCGNGQLRLAVWVLLDKLTDVDELWYAGDFDPEGLLIAQKLKQRYPKKVRYWRYEEELYVKYLSEKEISESRKSKLRHIKDVGLEEVKQAILKFGKAVYQESMLGEYRIERE